MKEKHIVKKALLMKNTVKTTSPLVCGRCNKTFKDDLALTAHIKTHDDTECSFCQKTFKSKQTMLEHKSHVHIKMVDKYCQFCKKIFETKFCQWRAHK